MGTADYESDDSDEMSDDSGVTDENFNRGNGYIRKSFNKGRWSKEEVRPKYFN